MEISDPVSMLLQDRGDQIFSIPSTASVYSAIEMMADKNVGALLVIDDKHLVGIISERDYTRKVILRERSSRDTFVREIMTPSPITINRDTSVAEGMRIMRDHHIRHVPVIDSAGHVVGVLSLRDLLADSILTSAAFDVVIAGSTASARKARDEYDHLRQQLAEREAELD
jgi:CBS domain-containing protein